MKQAKHTPGKWNTDYDGDGVYVTFENGPDVYDTTGENEDSLNDIEELEANARLIAAAPEMLEFLERLMASTPDAAHDLLVNFGDDLITKATGVPND